MKSLRKLQSELVEISRSYYEHIPLGAMLVACEDAGLKPVDEDGSPWEGFLCGHEGRASIALEGSRKALQIQWYRMESGRFEVNAYVS